MLYEDLIRRIIMYAIEAHKRLGNGFPSARQEVIYQSALEIEMEFAGLSFHREMEMPVLKAIIKLEDVHLAQAMN